MPSFDVVSKVDMQEVKNAINNTVKEVATRYDFRGSSTDIALEEKDSYITLTTEDTLKLGGLRELLNLKLTKRGVSLKALEYLEPEEAGLKKVRQRVNIIQGIAQDKAKELIKTIKDEGLKRVQIQIQGDELRVSGTKKDDLQEAIRVLKEKSKIEVQFVNFRD